MRDGEFVGARPPYGYRKDPDNCHRLLVNEDTAPIVRQIFQWTVDGVPLNEIVKRLNEASVLTPGYTENILRGRVFCGCCGKNLHRQRHQCGYYLYHCISNDRIGKGACDAKVYVREADLFSTIVTIIRQKAENVMGESLRLKRCDGKIAAKKAVVDKEISELRQQTQKNRDLLASLYESFIKGILTRAEYLEMQEDYSRKISGAVERVQQLQTEQAELERQMARYTSMADKLAAVDQDTTLSALLVDQLIERVTVNSPEDVSIDFAFESGFERVMEVLADE